MIIYFSSSGEVISQQLMQMFRCYFFYQLLQHQQVFGLFWGVGGVSKSKIAVVSQEIQNIIIRSGKVHMNHAFIVPK